MSPMQAEVFVLNREISDQYGTFSPVAVFLTRAAAEEAATKITKHRTFIITLPLDPKFVSPDGRAQ